MSATPETPDTTECSWCGRDVLDATWLHKGQFVSHADGDGVVKECFEVRKHTHPPRDEWPVPKESM